MRVIAGTHRGARIAAPKGLATRPTGDRVREAAFNLIGPVDDARVLDLFAGSGAMGLEALSRGAASVTFVESDRAACRTIAENLEKLRLTGARVVCGDALWALQARVADVRPRPRRPAVRGLGGARAEARGATCRRVLAPDGLLVVETGARTEPSLPLPHPHVAAVRFRAAHPLRAPHDHRHLPRSYDPVTFGHVDVIARAAAIFDRVVVGVVGSPRHKTPLFTLDERVEFLKEALGDLDNVEVDVFSELVVEFARRWQAKAIVKGLRVISDFEWEFQMNQLNRHLAPEIETVYVMASPQVSFVSSSGVKEIAAFGGKVDELVPESVARRLAEKFPNGRPGAPENPRE